MTNKLHRILIVCLIICKPSFCLPQYEATGEELMDKAELIGKFANFTEWPTSSERARDSFVISVIGDTPYESLLAKMYCTHKINNMPVQVKHIDSLEQAQGSYMLYISPSEKNHIDEILCFARDNGILTIADTEGYGHKGVHINLYLKTNGKPHFEVNIAEVQNANIRLDVYLLEIAKIVE